MLILFRPVLVGALLIATSLGVPGGATAEFSSAPTPSQPRPNPVASEELGSWRLDSAIGFPGDLDLASPSVKLPELSDGSAGLPDLGSPWTSTYVPVRTPPTEPSARRAAVAVASPTVPKYEVEENHHVRQFVDQFQTGYRRAVVEKWLARSGQYLPMILDVFRQKGLPDELVFTAMIESGFNPVAVSRAGAKGLWQFMAPTARRYGLRIDEWLDERLDPEKSTMAAARHLLDLYAVFGSWNLVQAAYNAGEMRVLQAIRAMGTSDFWTLRSGQVLRDETKNFIPAIQAAALIAREPERYGFVFIPAEPLSYEVVTVPRGTSLTRLAARSDLPIGAFERLNPELKVKQTPPDSPYPLKVPVGGAKGVRAALELEAPARQAVLSSRAPGLRLVRGAQPSVVHVVKARETVVVIAKRYGVTVADLSRWNDLDATARIRPGDRLRVTAISRREEGQGGFR
jgi:membrane-bound lytic murein transglycosylase D